MKRFKSAGQAQRFLSAHDQINNLFHLRRDHVTAAEHKASRTQTFRVWAEICSTVLWYECPVYFAGSQASSWPDLKAGISCRCRAAPRCGGRQVDMVVTGERR
jgi:hypothetical protein